MESFVSSGLVRSFAGELGHDGGDACSLFRRRARRRHGVEDIAQRAQQDAALEGGGAQPGAEIGEVAGVGSGELDGDDAAGAADLDYCCSSSELPGEDLFDSAADGVEARRGVLCTTELER